MDPMMIIIYILAAVCAVIMTKALIGKAGRVNTIVVFLLSYFGAYIFLYSVYLLVVVVAGMIGAFA